MTLRWFFLTALLTALFAGCADDTSSEQGVEEHAFDTAEDYASNVRGLITTDTLARWVSDWSAERPDDATGDLVVLQFGLDPDEEIAVSIGEHAGVRAFDISEDIYVLNEPRNNGIFTAGQAPARGVRIDAYLRKYHIDPREDFVVFVAEDLSEDSLALLSKAWLALHYWGFPDELLAIVNGDLSDIDVDLLDDEPQEAEYDGEVRVLVLPSTNFDLTLSLEDVRDWVQDRPEGIALWDNRTEDAYEGRVVSDAPYENSCAAGAPECTAIYGGRIAGAQHLDAASFLDSDARILEPEALRALLQDRNIDRSRTHYLYDGDGARSALVAFILLAVTGQDARWYPNSFVEWSALNATHPESKLQRLSEDNPWRTDTAEFSEAIDVWAELRLGVQPIVINSKAEHAQSVLAEDERYLVKPTALPVVDFDSPDCF